MTAPGGFLAKYNPSGALLWATGVAQPASYYIDSRGLYQYSGSGNASGIGVDAFGNVLIAGGFNGQVTFGSFTLSDANGNGFLAKLDPNGNYLWVENVNSYAGVSGLAVDSAGDSYITGQAGGQGTFGSITVTLPAGGVCQD